MSLSLDDKLLGEKVDNYCSSDEGEREEEDDDAPRKSEPKEPTFVPEPEIKEYNGYSTNTGPKGVINDWREFKRLETEKREEQEREKQALLKKLSITCRSHLDDEREKQKDDLFMEQLDREMEEFEEEFMKQYREKRIEEMRRALQNVPKYGKVVSLNSHDFVDEIDKEQPQVLVIVHVYEDKNQACKNMNTCLVSLAEEYPTVKFCKIKASETKLSMKFAKDGVPALLIYKGGEMIGNFVRISDELGDDFFTSDIESFLEEHSLLPSNDIVNKCIKDKNTGENRCVLPQDDDDIDSDFDLD